ncbi:hypothetical protein DIPPA_30382 [Diplonema papillatum]|nr:hypothetical protein DIPPA_30382 [Diplonema papillatum]
MMPSTLMPQTRRPKQPPAGGVAAPAYGADAAEFAEPALICCLHNKTRGPNNVEPIYQGSRQYKCKPGSECKLPDMAVMATKENHVTCSVHGKVRGPNNVEPTYPGSNIYKCKLGSECKIPTAPKDAAGGGGGGGGANTNTNTVMCSVHHKTRGPMNVEPIFPGANQWKCKSGSECKVPGTDSQMQVPGQPAPIHPPEPATCWAHSKKRSPNQLHQVNTPFGAQWECLPQYKCKGAAGAPAPPTMPTTATAAVSAGGTPYPVPMTGMDPAYLHQAMLNYQSIQSMHQLQNQLGGVPPYSRR